MVLLIDNYDSFSYNLYQLIGELQSDIRVIRNDEMTVEEIEALNPTRIILSPGPGRPQDAGICEEVIRKIGHKIPILGVCLGHQAVCEVYGADITYAPELMHGKQSEITILENSKLFRGLGTQSDVKENQTEELKEHMKNIGNQSENAESDTLKAKIKVARYHSLVADANTVPEQLQVTAVAEDGTIMAVQHKEYPVYGLQFHPESILTPDGKKMLENFMED